MALKKFNSVEGYTVGGNTVISVIDANGNVTANYLTVTNDSNLGNIANITITGGSNGQAIITDGAGNLSFSTISGSSNKAAPMPWVIPNGESFIVNANFQGLYGTPITINGELVVDGVLVDVSGGGGTPGGSNTQIQFNDAGAFAGSANFTLNTTTNVLSVPEVQVTGNIIPTANVTYNLGNNTNRFNNLFLAGNTINLGNAIISANATAIIMTNPSGGEMVMSSASNLTLGNISSINIDGNTSNILYGNGVFAGAPVTYGNSNVATFLASFGSNTITTTGNVSVGNIIGNGQALTGLPGGNVTGQVANATVAGTVYTAAQPNITSVGTLSSLTVTGNANTGNIGAAAGVFTTVAGSLTTAAQSNITSVGTLASLDVTGNITTSANLVTDLIVGKTTGISISSAGTNQPVYLKPSGTGAINVWSAVISNVATPVASTDAATKGYVDAAVEGLHIHAPCIAATPDTLANISSGTVTYDNGTSGVGATLTTTGTYTTIDGINIATANTRVLVKSEANAAHNGIYIYSNSTVLTRATDFDTPTEMGGGDFTFIQQGTLYNDTGWVMTDPVTTVGTTNVNFVQFSGAGTYTAGTGLTLTGTQFSISNTAVSAGTYGNGDAVASFTVNAQGQITNAANTVITANAANLTGTTLNSSVVTSSLTSTGTLSSLTISGNLTVDTTTLVVNSTNNIVGIGAAPSVNNTPALLVASTFAAPSGISPYNGLYVRSTDAVTGNVGGVISLGGVYQTGQEDTRWAAIAGLKENATDGQYGGYLSFYSRAHGGLVAERMRIAPGGNVGIANTAPTHTLSVTGTMNVSGNANVGNIGGAAGVFTTVAGSLTTAAQPNVTSVGTLSSLTVTGNVTAGNLLGILANTTSNISIPAAAGNITMATAGSERVRIDTGGNVGIGNNAPTTALVVNGTATVTTLVETSSITLKENLRPLDNSLDKILQISGYMYDRKDNSKKDEVGLIADHVAKVMPELVSYDVNNNPETLSYTRLTAYLVEAIKTLKTELDNLKTKKNTKFKKNKKSKKTKVSK